MYIHLHGHSHYSLLEAIGKPKDIAQEAKDYEMPAIALTDYNWLFGAIEFYEACKKIEVKPLLWVELWFVPDKSVKDKNEQCGHITLLAKSYTWYLNLLKITSEANLHGWNDKARIDIESLSWLTDDLYVLCWGVQSFLAQMLWSQEDHKKIKDFLQLLITTFGPENCLLELTVQDESSHNKIRVLNNFIKSTSKELNLRMYCSNNFHYIDELDQKVSEVALAIKDWKRMYEDDRRKVDLQQHIMSEKEIRNLLMQNWYGEDEIESMILTTQEIADSINIELPLWNILFPKYTSPLQDLYEEHKSSLIVSA